MEKVNPSKISVGTISANSISKRAVKDMGEMIKLMERWRATEKKESFWKRIKRFFSY